MHTYISLSPHLLSFPSLSFSLSPTLCLPPILILLSLSHTHIPNTHSHSLSCSLSLSLSLSEVTSKATSTNDIASNNILSTLQLSDIVQSAAAGGGGATAESILQSVVNLVGAAQLQSVTAATTSAESAATTATPATAEDTGKGGFMKVVQ